MERMLGPTGETLFIPLLNDFCSIHPATCTEARKVSDATCYPR